MPAHRRRKKKTHIPWRKVIIVVTSALLVFIAIAFFSFRTWNGRDKFILTHPQEDGNIAVEVFNPDASELTEFIIPGDTQVDVSHELGTWRLRSVWQLGINEGLEGSLLKDTVIKNFYIPVNAWSSNKKSFTNAGLGELVKLSLTSYKSSLKPGDKIRLALYSFNTKEFKKTVKNLADTRYLTEKKLLDGENGYEITDSIPQDIYITSSNKLFTKDDSRISLTDATGEKSDSEMLVKLVEVMGAKISRIENESKVDEVDCLITSENLDAAIYISSVLECNLKKEKPKGSFDFNILIGKKFSERF